MRDSWGPHWHCTAIPALSEKLPKWHFLIRAWNLKFFLGQMTLFEVVLKCPSLTSSKKCIRLLFFFQDEHGNKLPAAEKKVEEVKTGGNPYRRKKEKTTDDEIRILHEAYQFLLKRLVLVLLSKFYPEKIFHMAWIWIWMTKRPGVASDGNFSSYLIGRSWNNHFQSFSMGGNGNNTIYPLLST